jgi:aminoglycoside phosphotransferase (APT) family kinase protein
VRLRPHLPPLETLSDEELAHVRAVASRAKVTVSGASRVRKGKLRATYRVETPQGCLAMKVARSAASLRLEAGVIGALRSAGFEHVPKTLASVDRVDGLYFVVYEWVEGYSAKPPAPDMRIDRELARSTGGAVRELHDALADLEPFALPGISAWASAVRDSIAAIVERPPPLPRPLDADVAGTALDLLADGAPPGTTPIHGDIRFANLVFDERGDIRAFLDFEHLMSGTPSLESAVAVRNLFSVETPGRGGESRLDLANGIQYLVGYDADLGRRVRENGWAGLRRELILAILDEIRFVVETRDRLAPGRFEILMDSAMSQLEWAVRL